MLQADDYCYYFKYVLTLYNILPENYYFNMTKNNENVIQVWAYTGMK